MGSRRLNINKYFGHDDPELNLTEYLLADYKGGAYLVYNRWGKNPGEIRIDPLKVGDEDRTADLIRSMKMYKYKKCYVPQCIAEYLLEYDPTCFRNVENLIMLDDDYDIKQGLPTHWELEDIK